MIIRYLFFLGFIILSQSFSIADENQNTFSARDVFQLEYANDPRISPDGRDIVYERRSNDIMTDSTRSNIWSIKSDGTQNRPLISDITHVTSPRWSPTADRIAYLRSESDGTEIMVRWMDTGQTARLSKLRNSPSSLTWSPNGKWLAYTAPVKAKIEPLVEPRQAPEGAVWSEPVKVFKDVRYKRDGSGFVETAYSHIFIIPSDGGTPRKLTNGNFNHDGPLSWRPDGSGLFFSSNRNPDWEYEAIERDIYFISIGDGKLLHITEQSGGESMPVVSPDGKYLAYVFDDGRKIPYRNKILKYIILDDSTDKSLTENFDRSVSNIKWSGDSKGIYFTYDDQGNRMVAYTTLKGKFKTVADSLGGNSLGRPYLSGSYTVSKKNLVAYTHGTTLRPADVAVSDQKEIRILTSLNEDLLSNRILGTTHEIKYASSFDGTEIQGWYITPPGYDPKKKYPLILEIHGGPHSSYGPQFSAELQRFSAEGYVIFYNNYRGSTGYGEDFALLLKYKYSSEEDFADHMSGVDELIKRGIVDPGNLFITGGSAGGIATAYAIGLTNRFKAAVVAKPIINWISKVLTADSYIYQIPYQFPGMPWDEYEHYWKRSPLSLVGNVTTPTMLITGEEDQRTPISETEQYYQALKLRKVDSVMIRVPGAFHGIAGKPSRLNAKVDNILAWFRQYHNNDDQ